MVNAKTKDIGVTVECRYVEEKSKPNVGYYLFSYKIKITNNGRIPIQVIRRKWSIFDSINEKSEMEGDGIIGFKPMIMPFGHSFEYESYCQLKSDCGIMKGFYTVQKLTDDSKFKVKIPDFVLMPVYRKN